MPPTVPPVTPPANTVSLGELQNPVSVQEAPPISEDFSSFVASRAPDLAGEQAAVDTSRSNIQDLNDTLATRGQRGDELDEQFGLSDLDARNAELSEDIAERGAAFNNAITNEEGAVRPIEFITGRQSQLRRQKAVELDGMQAIQAAVQGNITLAESRIEKTLEREFGALEDQLEAEKFELTENKGALSAKNAKATEQLERDLNERGRVLEEQKATKKDILSLATEAAANGAPNGVTAQITQAKTAEEALAIAGGYVGKLDRLQKFAQIRSAVASADKNEFDLIATKQASQDRAEAIANGELLPEQAELVDSIDSQFRAEPIVKDFNTAVAKRFAFEEVMENGVDGVQDLQLVYDYMKSVDPTSVVRESEFDMAAKSGNIFAGAYTKFNKGYLGEGGQLPEGVKTTFLNASNAAYEGRQQQYFNVKDQFGAKIDRRLGTDGAGKYLTAYEDGAPGSRTAAQNPEEANEGDIIEVEGERYRVQQDGTLITI